MNEIDVQMHLQTNTHTSKIPIAFTYEPVWQSSNHDMETNGCQIAILAKHLEKNFYCTSKRLWRTLTQQIHVSTNNRIQFDTKG